MNQPTPAGKPHYDFTNRQDLAVAGRFFLMAGALVFGMAWLVYRLGAHSLDYPLVSAVVGAAALAGAWVAGWRLLEWFSTLSPNARAIIPPLGLVPWNLALLALYLGAASSDPGPIEQLRALEGQPLSDWAQGRLDQALERAGFTSQTLLMARVAMTGLAGALMGTVLALAPRAWGVRATGAALVVLGIAATAAAMGRTMELATRLVEELARAGVL